MRICAMSEELGGCGSLGLRAMACATGSADADPAVSSATAASEGLLSGPTISALGSQSY
jgi:hypothetical protein